jgi:hypothetical protein
MVTLALRLYKQLITYDKNLENTRSRMESLFSSSQINFSDIEHVYSGLYLSTFNKFEEILEDLFIGLLSGTYYSKTNTIQCLLKVKPIDMTSNVVLGGKAYVDWLPYDRHTNPRAKNFFLNGTPFSLVTKNQRDNLEDYCIIRNALAHKSDAAHIKFQSMISTLPLLPQERTPAGYLRSKPSTTSPQTQYQIASLELENIVYTLCE